MSRRRDPTPDFDDVCQASALLTRHDQGIRVGSEVRQSPGGSSAGQPPVVQATITPHPQGDSMSSNRHLTSIALAGLLLGGLTACGGEDEPAASPPADAAAESPEDAAADDTATEEDMAEETTEEEATEEAAGSSEVPPLEDLWPTVIDNANSAESMTATITGSDDEMTIDATLSGQLDNSNFSVDATIDGAQVQIIAVDEVYYLNGDEAFWTMAGASAEAETLAGQWIETPPEMNIGDSFSLSSLWEEFFSEIPTDASDLQTSAEELGEVDGVEAYHYTIEDEEAEIWISADGEDNLLRVLISEGMEEPLEMVLTDWNSAEEVEAPADAVPAEELMGSES